MKNEEPQIKELAERDVACVSFTGNYVGNAQVFANLFNELGEWAAPRGLMGPETVFLSAYQDDPETTPPDELTLECCMSIPAGTEVDGDIRKKVLPGGRYVVMHAELEGPEEYGKAWEILAEWIQRSGQEMVDMSRPSYEVYLNNPEEHPAKHHIIEICMSVKKR